MTEITDLVRANPREVEFGIMRSPFASLNGYELWLGPEIGGSRNQYWHSQSANEWLIDWHNNLTQLPSEFLTIMQIPAKEIHLAKHKARLMPYLLALDELLKENIEIYDEAINPQGKTIGVPNSTIYSDFRGLHEMAEAGARSPRIFWSGLDRLKSSYDGIKARYKTHMRMRGWI